MAFVISDSCVSCGTCEPESSRSYFSGRQPVRNRRRRLCKLWYMCRGLPNRSYQRGIILKEFFASKTLAGNRKKKL